MTLPGILDIHDGVTGPILLVPPHTAGCTADHTLLCGRGEPACLPGLLAHQGQGQAGVSKVDIADQKLAGPGGGQEQEQEEPGRWHGAGQEGSGALSEMGAKHIIH